MPVSIQPRKDNPNRSKTVRRKMNGSEREALSKEAILQTQAIPSGQAGPQPVVPNAPAEPAAAATPAGHAPEPVDPRQLRVKKFREGLIVEQSVEYNAGKGKPIVYVTLRLTTAMRGKRKNNDLQEVAYLLRLEVLAASAAVQVEGLILGPWQLKNLHLETGGIFVAEPFWAGFQPHPVELKGRVLLGDPSRHRILDLPLYTEAIVPGPEVFG